MFVTWKWIEVNDLSGSQYFANKNKRFKSPTLGSDLYDHNDSYIVVKGTSEILAAATKAYHETKKILRLKIALRLGHAYQKLTIH